MSGSIRVLHVDDEPDFGELSKTFLEREDSRFAVETATAADEALRMIEQSEFDCIVSDYDMPGKTGIGLLEAVRQDCPDLPFILFTGKGSEEVASDAISRGATDYLQKTSGSEQYAVLANRIANAVEQHRSRVRLRERERELEQKNEQLQRVRERLELALSMTSTYTFEWVPEEDEIQRHPTFQELFGHPSETAQPVFDSFLELVHPEHRDRVTRRYREAIDEGQPYEITFPVGTADSEYVWVEERATVLEDEEPPRVVGTVTVVTKRKEYERQLEAVVENLPGYVYRHRNESGWPLEFVKGSPAEVTGYTARELENDITLAEEIIHPEDREFVRQAVETGLEESGSYDLTYRIVTKDGEHRWIWERGKLIEDPVDGEEKLDGFITDITDQKERERQLELQNQRLEEFASVVSHDLRSPLEVAELRTELAREECDSAHLDAVEDAIDRSQRLIGDLLTLARGRREEINVIECDLSEHLQECWQTLSTSDATLQVKTDTTVLADESQLRQLFENLLQNAVTHAGPSVTVTVDELEDGDGFYVADDGDGIPESERKQVFEAGYSTADDGTGFGLRIVDQVAAVHGWDIRVTESAAGGVQFEIVSVEFVDK
jgi:PAS domain S-box-containing protein